MSPDRIPEEEWGTGNELPFGHQRLGESHPDPLIPEVIPARIRNLLRDSVSDVSAVSLLETAILHRLGRLPLARTLEDIFTLAHDQDIEAVELTPNIARLTNDLAEDFQGDSFDRTITTTARALKLILVTADRRIRNADFCNVEFYPFKPSRA